MLVAAYEPDRFEDAVPYYLKHRVRYADRLIRRIVKEGSLTSSSRVMDLGCGPGFIANSLSPFVGEVIGIDPNERMLEAAREEAKAAGIDNVTYRLGSSFDLSIVDGPFQLITMGRSFHWMDRVATLDALDALVAPNGILALLSDNKLEAPENKWWDAFVEVCSAFTPVDACSKPHRSKDWEPHQSVLMRSPFADVSHIGFFSHLSWTVDDLIGLALSQSGTTSRRLGDRKIAFEQAMSDALTPFAGDGQLTALVEHTATIARRPRNQSPIEMPSMEPPSSKGVVG